MDSEIFYSTRELVIDSVYSFYASDHSLRYVRHIHPMFYNGTYSENNVCQPEEPELLMSKEDFIIMLDDLSGDNNCWRVAYNVLLMHVLKQVGWDYKS